MFVATRPEHPAEVSGGQTRSACAAEGPSVWPPARHSARMTGAASHVGGRQVGSPEGPSGDRLTSPRFPPDETRHAVVLLPVAAPCRCSQAVVSIRRVPCRCRLPVAVRYGAQRPLPPWCSASRLAPTTGLPREHPRSKQCCRPLHQQSDDLLARPVWWLRTDSGLHMPLALTVSGGTLEE